MQNTRNPLDLWIFRTKWFRRLGKKIYFYRLGVDVKQEKNLEKLKKIFKKSWKISVRDAVSKQILEHIGIQNVLVEPDPVFFDLQLRANRLEGDYFPTRSMCLQKVKSRMFQVPDLRSLHL